MNFNTFEYFSGLNLEPVPEEKDEIGEEEEEDWQGVQLEWTGVLRRPSIPATQYTRVIQVFSMIKKQKIPNISIKYIFMKLLHSNTIKGLYDMSSC